MGLQVSSSSPSSIKVSMGKREYQSTKKGDFSFPLTSLRENLIVRLEDADGNEILLAGVETKSIVERGTWEDLFPLGEGHVRLKLQFFLNEEERSRIRIMRESALKKKQGELLCSSPKSVKSDGNMSPSSRKEHEIQESLRNHPQLEAEGVQENAADQHEETSSKIHLQPVVDITGLRHSKSINKINSQFCSKEDHHRSVGSQEAPSSLRSSKLNLAERSNLISKNLEGVSVDNSERQILAGKTPSSVKKMISAFESSIPQDMRSYTISPPSSYWLRKSQSYASFERHRLREVSPEKTKPAGLVSKTITNVSLAGELQKAPTFNRERVEQISILNHNSSKGTLKLEELSRSEVENKVTDSGPKKKFQSAYKKIGLQKEKSKGSFANMSKFETTTVSDDTRRLCLTTSGKKVMDLMGGKVTKAEIHHQRMEFPSPDNAEKNAAHGGDGTQVNKHEKLPKKQTKSSDDHEISGGPVKQAIKVAVMVGFGLLVLFTRQRKGS